MQTLLLVKVSSSGCKVDCVHRFRFDLVSDNSPDQYMLGTQDTAQWSTGPSDTSNTVQYQKTDDQGVTRTAVITLTCPDDKSTDSLTFNGEIATRFNFEWKHKCLCWDVCKGKIFSKKMIAYMKRVFWYIY